MSPAPSAPPDSVAWPAPRGPPTRSFLGSHLRPDGTTGRCSLPATETVDELFELITGEPHGPPDAQRCEFPVPDELIERRASDVEQGSGLIVREEDGLARSRLADLLRGRVGRCCFSPRWAGGPSARLYEVSCRSKGPRRPIERDMRREGVEGTTIECSQRVGNEPGDRSLLRDSTVTEGVEQAVAHLVAHLALGRIGIRPDEAL